jgi:hypothetical protein
MQILSGNERIAEWKKGNNGGKEHMSSLIFSYLTVCLFTHYWIWPVIVLSSSSSDKSAPVNSASFGGLGIGLRALGGWNRTGHSFGGEVPGLRGTAMRGPKTSGHTPDMEEPTGSRLHP